jgi:hypothetical protein
MEKTLGETGGVAEGSDPDVLRYDPGPNLKNRPGGVWGAPPYPKIPCLRRSRYKALCNMRARRSP